MALHLAEVRLHRVGAGERGVGRAGAAPATNGQLDVDVAVLDHLADDFDDVFVVMVAFELFWLRLLAPRRRLGERLGRGRRLLRRAPLGGRSRVRG